MPAFFSLECANSTSSEEASNSVLNGQYTWLIGVGCSVVGSLATAFGTIMQKKAHNLQASASAKDKSFELYGIVFNRYWLLAFVVMVVVPLPFDWAAFAFAPHSVIAPMAGLTLVFSQGFAVKMLKEKMTRVEVIGTAVIISGVAMTTVVGAASSPESYDLCSLLGRYTEPDVIALFSTYVALALLCRTLLTPGWCPSSLERFKPEFYAFVAGASGGLMHVVFKGTGELVKGSVDGVNGSPWQTALPYTFILVIIMLSLIMLSHLNLLLSRVNAVIGTPLFFTNLIVCSTVAGFVYYREYKAFQVWQIVVFPAGILVVCAGVMFMSLEGINVEELRRKERQLALANQGISLRTMFNSPQLSLRNLLNSPDPRDAVAVGDLKRGSSSSTQLPQDERLSSSSSYSGDGPALATSPGSGAVSTSFRLDPDLEKGSH